MSNVYKTLFWRYRLFSRFPKVLLTLMQEQRRAKKSDFSTELPPDDLVDALELLKEIIRQFWSCFPYKPEVRLGDMI